MSETQEKTKLIVKAFWKEKKHNGFWLFLGDKYFGNFDTVPEKSGYHYYYVGGGLEMHTISTWWCISAIKEEANAFFKRVHPDIQIEWPEDPISFEDRYS